VLGFLLGACVPQIPKFRDPPPARPTISNSVFMSILASYLAELRSAIWCQSLSASYLLKSFKHISFQIIVISVFVVNAFVHVKGCTSVSRHDRSPGNKDGNSFNYVGCTWVHESTCGGLLFFIYDSSKPHCPPHSIRCGPFAQTPQDNPFPGTLNVAPPRQHSKDSTLTDPGPPPPWHPEPK